MLQFSIRFFVCNIIIAGLIGIFYIIRFLLKKHISARTQYNLWFLILGITIVPFLPFHIPHVNNVFGLLSALNQKTETGVQVIGRLNPSLPHSEQATWVNDFTISINKSTHNIFAVIFCLLWITGIIAMLLFSLHSKRKLKYYICKIYKSSVLERYLFIPLMILPMRSKLYKGAKKGTWIIILIPFHLSLFCYSIC